MEDLGGIPWLLIHFGWVALGAVLIYGIVRTRRMSARDRAAQQQATHENFRVDEDSA